MYALDPSLRVMLLTLSLNCSSVVCCRVSPLQKAQVGSWLQLNENFINLASSSLWVKGLRTKREKILMPRHFSKTWQNYWNCLVYYMNNVLHCWQLWRIGIITCIFQNFSKLNSILIVVGAFSNPVRTWFSQIILMCFFECLSSWETILKIPVLWSVNFLF